RVQERVDLAQRVEVVGHVVERDLDPVLLQDLVDDVGRDHLAQVADVDVPGGRDTGRDLVRTPARGEDSAGDLVGPVLVAYVNHAVPQRAAAPATKRKRTLISSSMTSQRKRGIGIA